MKMLVVALVLVAAGGQKGGGVRESVWAGAGGWLMGETIGIGDGDTYGYAGEGA